jgi:carbamoyl-phosphate synthase large subunit
MRVLITSAGVATAGNVISALRKSSAYNYEIHAIDMSQYAAGLYLADHSYIAPSSNDPGYINKIEEIISKHGINFLIPLHSSEIELFSKSKERIEKTNVRMNIPPVKAIQTCNDKLQFIQFMRENKFLIPVQFNNPSEINKYPVFIKPVSGSSSSNSFKICNKEDLEYYSKKYPGSIMQEFIDAPEYTIDGLAGMDSELIACVPRLRIKVKDGKTVVGKTENNGSIINEIRHAIKILKYTGPFNAQIFLKDQNIIFIEINPRLAAGGLPLSTESGVNIPDLMVRISFGENPGFQEFEDNLVMIRYLTETFSRGIEFERI